MPKCDGEIPTAFSKPNVVTDNTNRTLEDRNQMVFKEKCIRRLTSQESKEKGKNNKRKKVYDFKKVERRLVGSKNLIFFHLVDLVL